MESKRFRFITILCVVVDQSAAKTEQRPGKDGAPSVLPSKSSRSSLDGTLVYFDTDPLASSHSHSHSHSPRLYNTGRSHSRCSRAQLPPAKPSAPSAPPPNAAASRLPPPSNTRPARPRASNSPAETFPAPWQLWPSSRRQGQGSNRFRGSQRRCNGTRSR